MTETPADPIVAAKRAMRAEAIAARSGMSPDDRQQQSAALAEVAAAFARSHVPAPAIASAFLSIGEEIDTAPLIEKLHSKGYRIALPAMVAMRQPLEFREWAPGAPLVTVKWGIREPEPGAPVVDPDLVLVPLLAFDRSGCRLGYGGGFYDRTLARLRAVKSPMVAGLAFTGQEVDAVPHLDYDERLDWVLTPEGPIPCRT